VLDRQAKQLSRLVDDLLDVSRITRDRLELRKERVELARIVQAATEASRPIIAERGHELTVSLPDQVVLDADPTRLAQVFSNLLNNAAKYSEPNGRIDLSAERSGPDVIVRVRDYGIGIARDMLSRIFDLFQQVQPSFERISGGLGVGLTLVKRLVEMHGGQVVATSDGINKGSEFVVRLPVLWTAAKPFAPLTEAPRKASSASRVLVVDDYQDIAVSTCRLLRLLGYETRMAGDADSAMEVASGFLPDIALLDIGLPHVSGYELARRIRAQRWGAEVVLIAMTGWGQANDKRRSLEAGFRHHLVKPVAPAELARLLEAAIIAKGSRVAS
jgi:CheY-like chemotaxis protein/two-component sensor histidine kinase